MKTMLNKLILIFFFFFYTFSACFSQAISLSVINSSGGYVKTGYYQFEWNVGEMALTDEMHTSSNLIVTNGFLQSYLLNPGTTNSSLQFGKDEIKVFPNPATSYIEINFFTKQKGLLKIEMMNAVGQKIYLHELNGYGIDLIHKIPVNHLKGGVYLIYITLKPDEGSLPKQGVYKIIKVG